MKSCYQCSSRSSAPPVRPLSVDRDHPYLVWYRCIISLVSSWANLSNLIISLPGFFPRYWYLHSTDPVAPWVVLRRRLLFCCRGTVALGICVAVQGFCACARERQAFSVSKGWRKRDAPRGLLSAFGEGSEQPRTEPQMLFALLPWFQVFITKFKNKKYVH